MPVSGSLGRAVSPRRPTARSGTLRCAAASAGSCGGRDRDCVKGFPGAHGMAAVGFGQKGEAPVAAHDGESGVGQAGEIARQVARMGPAAVHMHPVPTMNLTRPPNGNYLLRPGAGRGQGVFSKAVSVAAGFTRPVVICSRTTKDVCSSAIGACVVLNRDGWILTAAHLLDITRRHQESARRHRDYQGNVIEFQRDMQADKRFRKKGVRTFHRPKADSVRNHSVWWGMDGTRLVDARMVPAADLAFGRLEPFDPASVAAFPVLKNPERGCVPGTSLCKLGFPLHRIEPVFDEKTETFTLPAGSVPLPLFPLEGMFTRVVNARAPGVKDGKASPFIETSTPSLIGQMGGPLVDTEAVLWGIQSHTRHHATGFRPQVPGGTATQVEHQFLSTSLAVHASVIRQHLDAEDIAYESEG